MKGKGRTPEQENSKHESGPADRNSKQFQMTKICKIIKQAFFGFGFLDFFD